MTKTAEINPLKITLDDLVHANKNGHIDLTFSKGRPWSRTLRFFGGQYRKRPPGTYGVNLKEEDPRAPSDAYLPIRDFGIPTQDPDEVVRVLAEAVQAAVDGKIVWFGCAGGIGRTGTALALLASASSDVYGISFGPLKNVLPGPVRLVRDNYMSHAVETEGQMDYIEAFDHEPLRKAISSMLIKAWIKKLLWPFY